MALEESLSCDDLLKIEYASHHAYIHRHHRYALCILKEAQEKGWVPTPCDLVMFDQHHDGLVPRSFDRIKEMRINGFTVDEVIDLCGSQLSTMNDDWVIAGMELGMIRDCVVFGVHRRHDPQTPKDQYEDHQSQVHKMILLGRLEGELGYQGRLSDLTYETKYTPIWDILRWHCPPPQSIFSFQESEERFWVDFDLDVFAIRWSDYVLPWDENIFCSELLAPSDYGYTKGWSGKKFIQGLLDMAGLFTIATEPKCCGGKSNVLKILERFNRYVFDGELEIPSPILKDE